MKPASDSSHNESTEKRWLNLPEIAGDEFLQAFAVAQLAVRLYAIKKEDKKLSPVEKQNLDPEKLLPEAWELIAKARDFVLRPQTDAEYLADQGGTKQALTNVIERKLRKRSVPFEKLCDPERNRGDTETIAGIPWKVFLSERGFDKLFWNYWRDIGEKLKEAASRGGPLKLTVQGEGVVWPEAEVKERAKLARDTVAWKKQVQQRLKSWKQAGVWLGDFLALADFRRERDNRAANLTRRKRKRKAAQRASR